MVRPLFVLLTGIASGEMFCSAIRSRLGGMIYGLLFFLFLFLLTDKIYKDGRNYVQCIAVGFLIGFLLFCLAAKEDSYLKTITEDAKYGTLYGEIVEVKENTETERMSIVIKNAVFTAERKRITLNKRVMVYADIDLETERYPGDLIMCEGKLSVPEEPTNPGQFNQKVYNRARGIYYIFFEESYELKERPIHSIRRMAYQIKKQMESVYDIVYSKRQAGLLYAMVLGDKTLLSEDDKKIYEENGVAALLCISGLHISLVSGQCYQFLRKRKCSYFVSCLVGTIVLLFYGCMTGFGSSVTRAVLMFLVYLGAEWFGTYYDILSAMSLSGILMLVEHPYRILEGGFLISYASILAIGFVLPMVQEWRRKQMERGKEEGLIEMMHKGRKVLVDGVTSSAMIYAVTMPIIMRFYFEVTPYGILLNPLVIPFMGALMIFAILVGVVGGICLMLSIPITNHFFVRILIGILGTPSAAILASYEKIFTFARTLPGALIITGCPDWWEIALIYLSEAIILFLLYREQYKKMIFSLCFIFACILLRPSNPFQITMLDIGQGDCILIHTKEGKNILMDGGSTSKQNIYSYILKPALYYYGISKLDLIVVSHMDEDHISGIRELLEDAYPVELMVTDDGKFEEEQSTYVSLKKMQKIQEGDTIHLGKATFSCLHPSNTFESEDENAKSVVMHFSYEDFTALFTGDLGTEQEEMLLKYAKNQKNPLTILKVGHHGSKYSTGKELLEAYEPSSAIISAGKNNRYNHPHPETLKRLQEAGIKIWQTKEGGAIIVRKRLGKWKVDYYKKE